MNNKQAWIEQAAKMEAERDRLRARENARAARASRLLNITKAALDSANADNAELLAMLEWLDRKGGLGIETHERIRAVIDKAKGLVTAQHQGVIPMAKTSALDDLPIELARRRIFTTEETCKFLGISVAQWRRLRDLSEAPLPVMLGTKKQGWRLGDLVDYVDSKTVDLETVPLVNSKNT